VHAIKDVNYRAKIQPLLLKAVEDFSIWHLVAAMEVNRLLLDNKRVWGEGNFPKCTTRVVLPAKFRLNLPCHFASRSGRRFCGQTPNRYIRTEFPTIRLLCSRSGSKKWNTIITHN